MSLLPDPPMLRLRALAELSKAFEEARGELSCDWVEHGDLDLVSLRDDPALKLVLSRYRSNDSTVDPRDEARWRRALTKYRKAEATKPLRGYPARPWGDPERRAVGWAVVAALLVDLAGIYIALASPDGVGEWAALALPAALAAFTVVRCLFAWREARRSNPEQQAKRLKTKREGGRS